MKLIIGLDGICSITEHLNNDSRWHQINGVHIHQYHSISIMDKKIRMIINSNVYYVIEFSDKTDMESFLRKSERNAKLSNILID